MGAEQRGKSGVLAEAVDPAERRERVSEGRVVHRDDRRAPVLARAPRCERSRRSHRSRSSRSPARKPARRRRHRDDERVAEDGDRPSAARRREARERSVERSLEGAAAGVSVVVAGDQGHPRRRPRRGVEHFGEHTELRVHAVLGQVPGDDEMIGAGVPSRPKRGDGPKAPSLRVLASPERQELQPTPVGLAARPIIILDEVKVAEMRNGGHDDRPYGRDPRNRGDNAGKTRRWNVSDVTMRRARDRSVSARISPSRAQ